MLDLVKKKYTYFVFYFAGITIFYIVSWIVYRGMASAHIISGIIIILFLFLAIKKFDYALVVVIGEFLVGQAGIMMEFFGVSLRLIFFVIVMAIWLLNKIKNQKSKIKNLFSYSLLTANYSLYLFAIIFFLLAIFSFTRGVINGNDLRLALGDLISYSFIFLFLPLKELWKDGNSRARVQHLVWASLVFIFLFTFLNLIIFAWGIMEVHSDYYFWLRKLLIGKITNLQNGFFRIVFPSHIWIFFLMIVAWARVFYDMIRQTRSFFKQHLAIAALTSAIMIMNFGRAYFVGAIVALLFLFLILRSPKWLKGIGIFLLVVFIELSVIFLISSKGQSLGLSDFFGRLQTITRPEEELSGLTRLEILKPLLEGINTHWLWGVGLGSTIKYANPLDGTIRETYHLDWGYLELWYELGVIGFTAFSAFLFFLGKRLTRAEDEKERCIAVALVALAVATFFGPFLYHSIGSFLIATMISYLYSRT